MKMEIDAARLLVWRGAWMGRTGQTFENAEGSMAKLKAGEVAVWATERAIQILGGNGYTREFPVERMHRDAKIYTIFEGTSEIQRLVISARDLRRATSNRPRARRARSPDPAPLPRPPFRSSRGQALILMRGGGASLWPLNADARTVRQDAARSAAQPLRRLDFLPVRALSCSAPGSRASPAGPRSGGSERKAARPSLAHLALADVGVAVATGAERGGGVVDVDAAQPLEADLLVGFVEHRGEVLGVGDVVALDEEVAGVEAEAEALAAAGAARSAPRSGRSRGRAGPLWPAVCSSRSGQESLSSSAAAITFAARLIEGPSGSPFCAPGWRTTPGGADPVADPQRVGERGE